MTLLVVSDRTFDGVRADAIVVRLGEASCPVACQDHPLAMKFHALRHVPEHVVVKYLSDSHSLTRRCGRRVTDADIRTLCLRYGTEEIYRRLVQDTHE